MNISEYPHTRDSPNGELLTRSIGLSPPRLLYDRAANYGSIIIPKSVMAASGGNPDPAVQVFARSPFSGSWRTYCVSLGLLPHLGTYLVNAIQFSKCLEESVVSHPLYKVQNLSGKKLKCISEIFRKIKKLAQFERVSKKEVKYRMYMDAATDELVIS